jgi:hypothetical protein
MSQTKLILGIGILVVIIGAAYYSYNTFASGTLAVKVTDPPKDWGNATHVYILYSAISVHRAGEGNETGWSTVVQSEGWVDLRDAINATKTLGSGALQPGTYNLIRFEVKESKVTVGGQNYTATVSSGKLNIAIVQGGVTINAGQTSSVVIDITPKVVGSPTQGFRVVPAAKAFPQP